MSCIIYIASNQSLFETMGSLVEIKNDKGSFTYQLTPDRGGGLENFVSIASARGEGGLAEMSADKM